MKYRLGKKNKRAILEVETGHEYLVFPQSKTERIQEFLYFLNKTNSKDRYLQGWRDGNKRIEFNEDKIQALIVTVELLKIKNNG